MEDPATRLCLSCGLCCDGSVFPLVEVGSAERTEIERLGLSYVEQDGGGGGFRQPCPAFCGRCGVYEARPRTCRNFRCKLLRNVADGLTSLEAAERTVETAKALLTRGEELGVDLATPAGRRAAIEAGPSEAPRAYLEAVAIGTFLERHFHKAKKMPAD